MFYPFSHRRPARGNDPRNANAGYRENLVLSGGDRRSGSSCPQLWCRHFHSGMSRPVLVSVSSPHFGHSLCSTILIPLCGTNSNRALYTGTCGMGRSRPRPGSRSRIRGTRRILLRVYLASFFYILPNAPPVYNTMVSPYNPYTGVCTSKPYKLSKTSLPVWTDEPSKPVVTIRT